MGKESFFERVKNAAMSMHENHALFEAAHSVATDFKQDKITYDAAIGKLCQIALEKRFRIRDLQKLFDDEVDAYNKSSRDKYR